MIVKFDEFSIGREFFTEAVTITKEDIIEFGAKYDPQYFHIDENKAEAGPYGSLIASGFHTLAVVWAEWIKMDILATDCLGGIGADKIRWIKPVRADDRLSGRFTVVGRKKTSDGKKGFVTIDIRITNHREEEVLTCSTTVYILV